MAKRLNFSVEQWEEVAYEVDLTRIGMNADWRMLEKGAKKLGIAAYVFRNWLLKWMLIYDKQTALMPIIRSEHDEQGNTSEDRPICDLPDLKRD